MRLVLALDKDDKSGLRSMPKLKTMYGEWIIPQRSRVAQLRRDLSTISNGSAHEDGKSGSTAAEFVLDRWDDALDRLCAEIRPILGDEMDQVNEIGLASIEE